MSVPSWLTEYFTMNPIVYAGSAVLLLCLTITILTYILCNSELKMPRKVRHCIPNLCFALLLLVVTFSFGARTTDPPLACQIVGIGIHYFSLCTLFWITILAYVLYKRMAKANRPPPPPNPEPSEGPAPPKPILGLYLLGWGLAVIACGIVAAISLGHYTQHGQDYCFLAPEPRLLAFYGPVGLLALVNFFLFFCMCHNIRRVPATLTSTDPDTEEVTDIEEVESAIVQNNALNTSRSVHSDDSVEDVEYQPVSQLRAVVGLLFAYAFVWTSGGFALTLPFPAVPYQELIFTVLYAVSSAALGIFIVVFYVFARRDCRTCWGKACGCKVESPEYEISNVRHVNGGVHHPPQTLVHTTASSIESHSIKSNNTNRSNGALKYSAAPLLPQANGHLTDSSITQESYPNFYNPKQNGMAKKYWQKKRQKTLITQLNRELDSGHNSSHTEGGRSDMQLSVEINAPAETSSQAYYSLPRPFTIHSQLSPKPPLPGNNYKLPPLPDHIRMPYVPAGENGLVQRPPSLPRNGAIPRPRDFDGQSSTSGMHIADGRSSISGLQGGADGQSSVSGLPHNDHNHYPHHPPGGIDVLTGLPENITSTKPLTPEQVENRQNEQKFSMGDPMSFLAQLEERIPPCPPAMLPQPEANNNSSHVDSDCPSSVASANRKNHRHHHHRRKKPPPKKWEDEFPETAPSKPAAVYTFVNHTYEERVRAKLLQKQMSEPGSVPQAVTEQLLPRSVSAYNHDQEDDDSDSSSSSGDSDAQLWHSPKHKHHHHHRHKEHDKKETSV